jgi:hypothetical protein
MFTTSAVTDDTHQNSLFDGAADRGEYRQAARTTKAATGRGVSHALAPFCSKWRP